MYGLESNVMVGLGAGSWKVVYSILTSGSVMACIVNVGKER